MGNIYEQQDEIAALRAENQMLREALQMADDADEAVCNCEEHEPEMAPETCEYCFPVVDDARVKRWTALGKLPAERRKELSDAQHETQTRKE